MGCINIGGKGIITVDGTDYEMNPRDGIYIGRGNKKLLSSALTKQTHRSSMFHHVPAHKEYPTVKIDITKAKKVPLRQC